MPLMSTCLSRLGSRFNLILDPVRRNVTYGSLGLLCQSAAQLVIGLDDCRGSFATLPFSDEGEPFMTVDQRLTMTSVIFEAYSAQHGVVLSLEITAPFRPRDREVSTVPAYLFHFRLSPIDRVRWTRTDPATSRTGILRVGLKLPGARVTDEPAAVRLHYPVHAGKQQPNDADHLARKTPIDGSATDLLFTLAGDWTSRDGFLEVPYDQREGGTSEFSLALVSYCNDALFERFGRPMKLVYTRTWANVDAVADYVRTSHRNLSEAGEVFDSAWTASSFPFSTQQLAALAFQSYLMNTLWAVGADGEEWFSVWEGSCWYNSTVDVTYNDAVFYFACWPELLELLFAQWSEHANDAQAERRRRQTLSPDAIPGDNLSGSEVSSERDDEGSFPGAILEHDMGAGWTANGQAYHHAMPVEENSDFLLMLYAHGKWWGRQGLYRKYNRLNRALVEYLLWTDSTGNGFPDRGTANTIDDATPAVQYGRDNVYLGIKRLAALHAARRMFEHTGDRDLARRCARAVKAAVSTLNAGWLGDHWGVCLDKSAQGLFDCWSGAPLPYKELPGWDAYTLYTTNGLLYLLMVDDLPPGLDRERLRTDLVSAMQRSMTPYGCGHSSTDTGHVWISTNIWRDAAGGYLGEDLLVNCERYWAQQVFGNSVGSDKPNCFTETSVSNNLVWYPRGAAIFALTFALAGLTLDRSGKRACVRPISPGRWPLLPLASWKRGVIPWVEVIRSHGRTTARLHGTTSPVKVSVSRGDHR